jgi:hypothetical protein
MIKKCFLLLAIASLYGCSGTVQLMRKDSGMMYTGEMSGCFASSCNMSISIDGENFSGVVVKSTSNEIFSIGSSISETSSTASVFITSPVIVGQVNGSGRATSSGLSTSIQDGGTTLVQGLLSSPNGHGLRCKFTATGNGGAGICINDEKQVFDAIVYR